MVVPALMWIKALDMILDKLRVCGVDFNKVAAISGCAQVHDSISKIRSRISCLKIYYRYRILNITSLCIFRRSSSNMAQSTGAKAAVIDYSV